MFQALHVLALMPVVIVGLLVLVVSATLSVVVALALPTILRIGIEWLDDWVGINPYRYSIRCTNWRNISN